MTVERNLSMEKREYRASYNGTALEYWAFGAPGLENSANGWIIYKQTLDGNGNQTSIQCKPKGVWDNRTSYF